MPRGEGNHGNSVNEFLFLLLWNIYAELKNKRKNKKKTAEGKRWGKRKRNETDQLS